MKTILESLVVLQKALTKGMQSVRTSLKKELLQHPSQISFKKTAEAALSNERIMQRSRSITAEIHKTIREQPTLTDEELKERETELEEITYSKNYRFDVIDSSKIPESKDKITGSVTLRSSGRKDIATDSSGDIWLKVSFIPKVGEASIFKPDETATSSFMEWYFKVSDCNLKYYDSMTVPLDFNDVDNADKKIGLDTLRAGVYYVKFGLIKGTLIGGYGSGDRIISAVFDAEKGITEFKNRTDNKCTEFTI